MESAPTQEQGAQTPLKFHTFIVGDQGAYANGRPYRKGEKVTIPADRLPAPSWLNLNGTPVAFKGEGKNRELLPPGADPEPPADASTEKELAAARKRVKELEARAAEERSAGTLSSLKPPTVDPSASTLSEATRGGGRGRGGGQQAKGEETKAPEGKAQETKPQGSTDGGKSSGRAADQGPV